MVGSHGEEAERDRSHHCGVPGLRVHGEGQREGATEGSGLLSSVRPSDSGTAGASQDAGVTRAFDDIAPGYDALCLSGRDLHGQPTWE